MKRVLLFAALAALFASCGGSEQTAQDKAGSPEAEQPILAGKQVFINNCIQCHNLETDKIGPKLEGSFANWNNDTTRFRAFIRNSQDVIKNGDARAVAVYEQWNKSLMTPMPHLTDKDIDEVLDYINKGVE